MALTMDEAELVATDLFEIRNQDRNRLNKIKMVVWCHNALLTRGL